MDLETAQNTFAVRLYEWSQRDFVRELEEGCPLVSTLGLNERRMAAFVQWNETLSSQERKALVIALTRRCHENAVRLKGEVLTEANNHWSQMQYEQCAHRLEEIPPLPTAKGIDPEFQPVNPDDCLASLAGCLSPVMGRISRQKSKVICKRKLGDWQIVTEFTFLRRDGMLSFEYQFIRKDGGPVTNPHPAQGPFPRTLLLFYGLSFSSVTVPSQKDSEPMARVMAKLAEYFVAQADPLFDGLGVED
jgi:hypothetical protein